MRGIRNSFFVLVFFFAFTQAQEANPGLEYLKKGSYEMARAELEKTYRESGGKTGAELLIELYRTTGSYAKAMEVAREMGKNDPRGKMLLGEILMYVGKYPEARDVLLEAYASLPDSLRVQVGLGMYYFTVGQKEAYIASFSKIFDRYDPDKTYSTEDLVHIARACRLYAMKSGEVDRSDTLKTLVHQVLPEAISKDKYCFPAYQEMVEIFLDAFNTVDAKTTLEDALKLNAHHPHLLYCNALFQSQRYELRPQSISTLAHALNINPNLVEALDLCAAICLSDEEYEKAQEYLDKALSVNPSSLSTRSLQAASYRMQGRKTAYEEECKKVLTVNPGYGELYHILAQMLLAKRQFSESARLGRRAIEVDPFLWHAYIELGMNLMRIGETEEAEKYLKKVREEYNFHTQTHNTLILLEKYKEYKLFSTENFKIRLHVSEAETMLPLVKETLENAFETLTKRYKFKPQIPIVFELFPNHGDFSVRTIGLESLGANGACFGQVIVGISPREKILGDFNWMSVAWHEFAHVITLQMTDYQIPRWFTEGLSELTEKQRNISCQRRMDMHLYSVYSSGQIRGIANFNAGFTRPRYPLEIGICYYQAGLICQMIIEKFGFDKIIQMLMLYRQEKKDVEVFQIALGMKLEEFDKIFAEWLEKNIFSKMNVFPSIDPKELEDLKDLVQEQPKNENAHLKLAIGYLQYGKLIDAEIYASKILSLSPKNPAVYDILGQIYYHKKNPDKARELLEKAALLGSKNFNSHLLLGLMYWHHAKNADLAIKAFETAKNSYPSYVEGNNPYLKLAEIYMSQGKQKEAFQELEAYLKFNGTDFKTRLELSKRYFHLKRYDAVVQTLNEAQEINPLHLELQDMLGKSYKEIEKPEMALRSYGMMLAMDPKEGKHRIYSDMAEIYLGLQNFEKARSCAEESLRIKPGFKPAEEVLRKIK